MSWAKLRIDSSEHVRTGADDLSPLGFVAENHAGYTKPVRLALDAAGIREDYTGVALQLEHVKVPDGVDEPHVAGDGHSRRLDREACARMHGDDHVLPNRLEAFEDPAKTDRVVRVFGAMHGRKQIRSRRQSEPLNHRGDLAGAADGITATLGHQVANLVHALRDALPLQVPHGQLRWAEE